MSVRCRVMGFAGAVAIASVARPVAAGECPPARPGPGVASLGGPWRHAVDSLLKSAGTEGLLWSCSGATIDLVEHDGGATLTVIDAQGRSVAREVGSPEDVEPLGEALLAKPIPRPEPPPIAPQVPAQATPPPPPVASDAPAPALLPDPRVLVSALVAPRYAGASHMVLGGATVAASIPFGRWSAGGWVRYDALSTGISDHEGELRELCVGASAGRSLFMKPFELRLSATGSAAVVTRSNGHEGGDTRVAGRFGAEARGVIPFTSLVRGVIALDGELAPAEMGEHHDDPGREPTGAFPTYTLGIGVGVELAPR